MTISASVFDVIHRDRVFLLPISHRGNHATTKLPLQRSPRMDEVRPKARLSVRIAQTSIVRCTILPWVVEDIVKDRRRVDDERLCRWVARLEFGVLLRDEIVPPGGKFLHVWSVACGTIAPHWSPVDSFECCQCLIWLWSLL